MSKLITISMLVGVVAMSTVSARGALVDENFNGTDPSWSTTGSPGFGFSDANDAITGTWARSSTTYRYYTTGSTAFSLDQDSSFTMKCDIEISSTGYQLGSKMMVGLFKSGEQNKVNSFSVYVNVNDDTTPGILIRSYNGSGTNTDYALADDIEQDTLYHFEVQYSDYNGTSNNLTVYRTGGTGGPKTYATMFNGTWSCDVFGTGNYDGGDSQQLQGKVDNMYLVPEPATMTLLLLGLPFALRRRRLV